MNAHGDDPRGANCIPEFVRYKYGEKQGDKFCSNEAGSCARNVCECDLAFAKNHGPKQHVYNQDYHYFLSTRPGGWEPKEDCPKSGGDPSDPKCCGGSTAPFVIYNAKKNRCCADASILHIGAQC